MRLVLLIILCYFKSSTHAQFSNVFSSFGNSKSQNIEFTIRYPDSWTEEDSDRPHILKRIGFKPNDSSYVMVLLMVEKLKEKVAISDEMQIRRYISSRDYISTFPLVDFTINESNSDIMLDNSNASFIDFNSVMKVLDERHFARDNIYSIVYGGQYLIHIDFKIRALSEFQVNSYFAQFKPVFKQMILSFVLTSKWKN